MQHVHDGGTTNVFRTSVGIADVGRDAARRVATHYQHGVARGGGVDVCER